MGQARLRKQALGVGYGRPPAVVWHYTAERWIPAIAAEGLRSTYRADGVCWFTRQEQLDPTSSVALSALWHDDDQVQSAAGIHPWRIAVPGSAVTWLPDALDADPSLAERLSGALDRTHGASHRDWYISPELAPGQLIRFQCLVDGSWQDRSPTDAVDSGAPVHRVSETEKLRYLLTRLHAKGVLRVSPKPGNDMATAIDLTKLENPAEDFGRIMTLGRMALDEQQRHGGPLLLEEFLAEAMP